MKPPSKTWLVKESRILYRILKQSFCNPFKVRPSALLHLLKCPHPVIKDLKVGDLAAVFAGDKDVLSRIHAKLVIYTYGFKEPARTPQGSVIDTAPFTFNRERWRLVAAADLPTGFYLCKEFKGEYRGQADRLWKPMTRLWTIGKDVCIHPVGHAQVKPSQKMMRMIKARVKA